MRWLDANQLLNNPVNIGDRFLKQRDIVGGSQSRSPPRQGHDRDENPILTVGRKPTPINVVVHIPYERPFFYVAFLRLGCRPPFYPFGPIGVRIDDDRHSIERTLLGFQPGL